MYKCECCKREFFWKDPRLVVIWISDWDHTVEKVYVPVEGFISLTHMGLCRKLKKREFVNKSKELNEIEGKELTFVNSITIKTLYNDLIIDTLIRRNFPELNISESSKKIVHNYDGSISPHDRFDIFKRDNYRCQICGVSAKDGEHVRLEVDHIVPKSKGGSDFDSNTWTLCSECNRGKSDKDL